MPSAEYLNYLESPQWRYLRERVKARDGYVCQDCGTNRSLHVHHLTYERIFREPLSDLITVCDDCHRTRHGLSTWRPAPVPAPVPQPRRARRTRRRLRVAVVVVVGVFATWAVLATLIEAIAQRA